MADGGLYRRIALKLRLPVTSEAEQQWKDELLAQAAAVMGVLCIPSLPGGVYFSSGVGRVSRRMMIVTCPEARPLQ